MKLNTYSYVHVQVRYLCAKLQESSNMKLITDLSSDFNIILFKNELSYLKIDWQNDIAFTMSHCITTREREIIQDIVLYLKWLYIGKKLQKQVAEEIKAEKKGGKKDGDAGRRKIQNRRFTATSSKSN